MKRSGLEAPLKGMNFAQLLMGVDRMTAAAKNNSARRRNAKLAQQKKERNNAAAKVAALKREVNARQKMINNYHAAERAREKKAKSRPTLRTLGLPNNAFIVLATAANAAAFTKKHPPGAGPKRMGRFRVSNIQHSSR